MSDIEVPEILIRLDDRQGWHVLVHANGPDGFSRGCEAAARRYRLTHVGSNDDVLMAVGLLNKMGDQWTYGDHCDYPVKLRQSRATHWAMWRQISDSESQLNSNGYTRSKAIE